MTILLVWLAFLLALYFPVALAMRSDWRSNAPGKSMMLWSLIVATILGVSATRSLGVDLPDWARAVSSLLVITGLLAQDITLTKVQNRRSARIEREQETIKESS